MSCRSSPFSLDPHNPFLCLTLIFEFTYDYIDECNLLCSLSIQENPKYAKYMNLDCSEIYDTYEKLFDDTGNSMKYALSPSKLSQRGFDLGTERRDEGDELPINAKTTDSSCCPVRESWDLCLLDDRANSSMNIFGKHGGEKRKRSHSKGKGHRKKYSAHEVSASLEQMVSVGNLASIAISHCM